MKKNVLIIGAGWYGCHLGLYLKNKGHKVKIYEKNKDIFKGPSGKNQFRLHNGYHYPRSSITINEVKSNFIKFNKMYGKFINFPKNNVYCIAKKESLIDFGTYTKILKANKLPFKIKTVDYLKNIEGAVSIKEGVLQNSKIKQFYKKNLKNEILYKKKIENIKKISKNFDFVIDCTNNTHKNNFRNLVKYILTISFVYKKKRGKEVFPVTIMDGKLPSIYPYSDKRGYFTLTHSQFTHIKSFNKFTDLEKFKKKISKNLLNFHKSSAEKSIINFYRGFKQKFLYKGYFLAHKVIPIGKTDLRPTFFRKEKNVLSLFSAKIANIFSAEKIVKNFINGK